MFDNRFPFPMPWTTNKKLIWLVGAVAGGVRELWKTVTGSLIHITDALASPMQKCEVTLEPIQDLHGQDAPYPAGGGKNLYNATYATITIHGVTLTNNGDGSYTVNGTADADVFFGIFSNSSVSGLESAEYRMTGCPSGGSGETYYMYVTPSYAPDNGGGKTFTSGISGGSIFIKSGYTCNNLVFRPMIRLASNGDDTFAPYSNICPITGWTGCEVTRTGKNVLNASQGGEAKRNTNGRANFIYNGADVTIECNEVAAYYLVWAFLTVTEEDVGKKFIFSGIQPEGADSLRVVSTTDGWAHQSDLSKAATFIAYTITSEDIGKTFGIRFYNASGSTRTVSNLQVEFGTEATAYEPYSGTTASVTFPDTAGTVYGGTDEIVSGTLTSEWDRFDLGQLTWSKSGSRFESQYLQSNDRYDKTLGKITVMCETYKAIANCSSSDFNSNANDFEICCNPSSARAYFMVKDSRFSTKDELKTALNGIYAIVKLYDQYKHSYEIEPVAVNTLQGENNVWSNGDSVEITYKAQA